MTSSWFFLSTLNYDTRSTTHQIVILVPAFYWNRLSTQIVYEPERTRAVSETLDNNFSHACSPESLIRESRRKNLKISFWKSRRSIWDLGVAPHIIDSALDGSE